MSENITFLIIGLITGGVIGFIIKIIINLTKSNERDSNLKKRINELEIELTTVKVSSEEKNNNLQNLYNKMSSDKHDSDELIKQKNEENNVLQIKNSTLSAKLETQKEEIINLNSKFKLEFENIANKILDTKTEKFTELNKENLKTILGPFSQNIEDFKKKVNETYDKESKERFSLGEKVKELKELNIQISEEAKNLTNALKGDSKTQGRWGEMILESILEKSGLRKDEEYFLEYQLEDVDGKPLRSDIEDKKMRPDAVIKYPDNRSIIIDSKVSLNAFSRYLEAENTTEQEQELNSHVTAVKNHIISLSRKGYDDYDKSLDFVMMFIPSEPAYMAALQGDHDLWSFAYDKRILLINPTNLIISLKLIVDLWKREYQNRNAQDIADRGAKLYDKFVGFLENFSNIEKYLDKSKEAYTNSFNQLSTGRDNLIVQTNKLKDLGIKNKKQIPEIFNQKSTDLISE